MKPIAVESNGIKIVLKEKYNVLGKTKTVDDIIVNADKSVDIVFNDKFIMTILRPDIIHYDF